MADTPLELIEQLLEENVKLRAVKDAVLDGESVDARLKWFRTAANLEGRDSSWWTVLADALEALRS